MKRRTAGLLAVGLALSFGFCLHRAAAVRASDTPPQAAAMAQFHLGGNAAEIPARFVNNLVFLPVEVNQSQPSLFQLDSTAAASTIDPDRAAELGITPQQAHVLNLSGVDLSPASLDAVSKKDFAAQVGREYEGTLGNDLFAGTIIEVNYPRQTVRIYDPATYQYAGRGKSVHLTFVNGLPVVHAKINVAGGKAIEGDFIVNTALDAALLISQKFAHAHRLPSHIRTIGASEFRAGGQEAAVLARVKEFELGGYEVAGAIAVFPREGSLADGDGKLAGEIGGAMLRRFTVTFDYPHQQLILDSSSDFRLEEIEDMSGLAILAGGPGLKRFEVAQVWPGTPGSDAKIQKGDVIAGINDEAAADLSLPEIRRLFRQPGAKCKLLIQRGNQTLTVNLQMRHLL